MGDEISMTVNVSGLRDEIRGPVEAFGERLLADLGDNLQSLSVVGSSLTGDFDPGTNDINTALVVGRRSHDLLKLIAGYGVSMGKKKLRAPLLMTDGYIGQSLDVFGVEFLDLQLSHATVIGEDPFVGLTIAKHDVRLQCERELKTALMRLRQGYIQSLGKPKAVGEMLLACIGQLMVILRAMLWLSDVERPEEAKATLDAAAEKFGVKSSRIEGLLDVRVHHKTAEPHVAESMFENVYQVIDDLSRVVDGMRVS